MVDERRVAALSRGVNQSEKATGLITLGSVAFQLSPLFAASG
jgi:hypothetical protein